MAGDTFGKLMNSLNRGVTAISVKTSSALEKAKIKTHIDSIAAENERLYSAIGKNAYEMWAQDQFDSSALVAQFEAIKQGKENIAKLETEYASIDERDSQILGTQSAAAEVPAEPVAPGITCPGCGTVYSNAVRFCRKCGAKLSD